MRQQVETKLGRVPLSYVDQHARRELLSRVTNDIDNLAQTLQQTLSQLINAALTIIGVLIMMFWISPLLAAIALVTLPTAGVVTMVIAKRAQPQFVAQWKRTGTLNAHVEEMYTGHALVKVFGRQRAASDTFHTENEALYEATFKANLISGLIQPAMMFLGNLNYVIIAVVGGLRVASGAISLGDVQAFIQYSRQFTQPIMQVASMMNLLQSGVASAARVTHVDRFVRTLPDGYETVIDEEADNVSTGEKQLLTIARAFLADPAILVLDEATSSVDTRTEVLVQHAMAALRHGRTSFVIAHRLSTIRDADVI